LGAFMSCLPYDDIEPDGIIFSVTAKHRPLQVT
jgi:hypothetical protein